MSTRVGLREVHVLPGGLSLAVSMPSDLGGPDIARAEGLLAKLKGEISAEVSGEWTVVQKQWGSLSGHAVETFHLFTLSSGESQISIIRQVAARFFSNVPVLYFARRTGNAQDLFRSMADQIVLGVPGVDPARFSRYEGPYTLANQDAFVEELRFLGGSVLPTFSTAKAMFGAMMKG